MDLFFKKIKQHLRITCILSTTENAKGTDIVRRATSVLLVIVKSELEIDASLDNGPPILLVSVFPATEISCSFQPDVPKTAP